MLSSASARSSRDAPTTTTGSPASSVSTGVASSLMGSSEPGEGAGPP
jgi:hypothetical protein